MLNNKKMKLLKTKEVPQVIKEAIVRKDSQSLLVGVLLMSISQLS